MKLKYLGDRFFLELSLDIYSRGYQRQFFLVWYIEYRLKNSIEF